MASIQARGPHADGTYTYRVLWRQDGRQRSLTFVDQPSADDFRINVDRHGPDEALRILDIIDTGRREMTLTQWLTRHVDTLTGVEDGTRRRYRSYIDHDVAPTIGHLPLTSVTDTTIARWVNDLEESGASGKTIANKHGFLAGALNHAVRAGKLAKNPCDHTRLPRTDSDEMVFLTREEFAILVDAMTPRWQPLTRWLVGTGTRFGEATALTVADITVTVRVDDTGAEIREGTARINKAWKYTGDGTRKLAKPKTRRGVRTISIPGPVLDILDLDREPGALLFPTRDGGPVSHQLYRNKAWLPALKKVSDPESSPRLLKRPRVHDLRHTCASWMIAAQIPLPVIQQHLGHESITTTVGTYGHLDQSSGRKAADAISGMLT